MSKLYSPAPSGVAERVAHLVKVFHTDLQDAGLKFDLISIADDDPEVDAPLKLHGYPCAAVVKAVDVKGRAMGRGDVEIVIDEARYLAMPDAQKDGLLDHEIEHIELQIGKKGRVKLDCCRRPKVKMRLHDVDFGWFKVIAERHGAASMECKQASDLYIGGAQTFFAFIDQVKLIESHEDKAKGAAKRFVDGTKRQIADSKISSVEISSGGKGFVIDKDGVRPTQ